MKITLNITEQRLAQFLAREKGKHHKKTGTVATIYNETSLAQNDLDSMGAEIAFCKAFNIYPNTEIGPDDGKDALLPDGRTVDVKVTPYKNGRLLVKVLGYKRDTQPDVYAMMIGKFPEYTFAGWIPAEEVIREEKIDRDLPHPAYAAGQNELRTP